MQRNKKENQAVRQSQTEPANPNQGGAPTDPSARQQVGQEQQRQKDEERHNPGQQTGGTGGAGAAPRDTDKR